jgi:hypothetical protein
MPTKKPKPFAEDTFAQELASVIQKAISGLYIIRQLSARAEQNDGGKEMEIKYPIEYELDPENIEEVSSATCAEEESENNKICV